MRLNDDQGRMLPAVSAGGGWHTIGNHPTGLAMSRSSERELRDRLPELSDAEQTAFWAGYEACADFVRGSRQMLLDRSASPNKHTVAAYLHQVIKGINVRRATEQGEISEDEASGLIRGDD